MGQLAAAAQIIGTVLSFTGSMQQASAQEDYAKAQAQAAIQAGQAQQQIYQAQALALEREAQQAEAIAGEERATAQRNAINERRRAKILQSRAQAVAAASGGGALDPTVVNLAGDIGAEGEYSALAALYEGDLAGQGYEYMRDARNYEATLARHSGEIARQTGVQQGSLTRSAGSLEASATRRAGYSSLFSNTTFLMEKYGGKKPETIRWNQGGTSVIGYR